MEVSSMSMYIIKKMNKNFPDLCEDECLDVIQIKGICNLYKINKNQNKDIDLTDICFSSPEFEKKPKKITRKNQDQMLQSENFIKKHSFFVRIIYACLKIDITIFNDNDDIITLKNNYQLIKSLESKKKSLIIEHINKLKLQCKNKELSKKIGEEYEKFFVDYMTKIKIIDKIISSISKLIDINIFTKTDNLLTLILPYFYIYNQYIEEYNNEDQNY